MHLPKYSMGIGDRFGREGRAQLRALAHARRDGWDVTPVWNKSFREHSIIGTTPADTRAAADAAVRAEGWSGAYFVDADHISLKNVEGFLAASDFFTLDVADFTGKPASEPDVRAFVERHRKRAGDLSIPGLPAPLRVDAAQIEAIARKYLLAVREAGRIYRRVAAARGGAGFVTEVSMDETDKPQTPVEILFILAAVADERIPAQTVAPKFTGRFNKGVDYVGDVARFEQEFRADLAVIRYAVREFGLPANLKLSVHSGSDKFSLYGPIGRALRDTGAGLHLKTAGTTWLEEAIGLALAGGDGLTIVKDVYAQALDRYDEMCGPYAPVIDIRRERLPSVAAVRAWSSAHMVAALRHDPSCAAFDANLRQLMHVSYKIAAELGARFTDALTTHRDTIETQVETNLYDRHLHRLFAVRVDSSSS